MANLISQITPLGSTNSFALRASAISYGTCSTAAGTAAKTVTCSGFTDLVEGATVLVKFANTNSAAVANLTLNVNGTGAKNIKYIYNSSINNIPAVGYLKANNAYLFYYDGTYWIVMMIYNSTYTAATSVTAVSTTSAIGTSAAYARQDHVHNIALATGDANGQVKIAGTNVSVKGLDTAAYTASTAYASASHNHDSVYAKKSDLASLVAATDAMVFKGTLGTGGTVTALPASHTVGDTYRVITAGTYAGVACEVGDLIICITAGTAANNAHWTVAQTNIDGAVTGPTSAVGDRIAVFNGTSGKVIKDSGYTIATSVPSGAKFTDTNYYHTSGTWSGFTYTASKVGSPGDLAFTIPTGTASTQVAVGNHTHTFASLTSKPTTLAGYGITDAAASGHTHATALVTDTGTSTITLSHGGKYKLTAGGTSVIFTMPSDNNTTYSAGTGLSLSGTTFNHSNSVTAGTISDGGATRTLAFGGTFKIPSITYDAQGHITDTSSITLTMPANPNTDTKNTAGSTDTSSKIFLIGATSQAANPQTYSDNEVFATNGVLSAKKVSTSAGVDANTAKSGSAGGVSLYGTEPNDYGLVMRNTGTTTGQLGKHGYVQGDWAMYFNFTGATGRGFVFRHANANVGSISGLGHAVFNGSLTVGGNTTNTSGTRMEYNSTDKSLDFIFV